MLALRKNYYSQFGEDGIIEYLFNKLGISDGGTCCEFGAWDGKHVSNTFHLVKNRGFKALYIEADSEKFQDLLETCKECPNITPVNEFVSNNLDDIFERHNFPFDIDLLSIDIDSTDYEVWKTTVRVNPKVVVIEPDGTMPAWIKTPKYPVHEHGGANYIIMQQLGEEKGYTLMCNTSNMIFVRNDLVTPDLAVDDRLFPWHLDPEIKGKIFFLLEHPTAINFIPEENRKDYLRYCEGVRLGYMDGSMRSSPP